MSKVAAVVCGMALVAGVYALMMDPKERKAMMKKAEDAFENMSEQM